MTLSKKITIAATEVVLVQLFSYNVVSEKNFKNENVEYHDISILFESPLYSKRGSPIFSCVMEFSIISSCLDKVKVFPIILTR